MKSQWRRSDSERMLGGVCGGLGDHLGLDVTLIRVFFVVAAMASGLGAALYMLLWLLTPPQGAAEDTSRDEAARIAFEEIGSQARHLGEEVQSAMDSDDPQLRMVVRWSLALLIGLVLKHTRLRRRSGHGPGTRPTRGDAPPKQRFTEETMPDADPETEATE